MQVTEFVPKTINEAPCVYQGCTLKELTLIIGVTLVIHLILCISITAYFGIPMVGLGLALILTLISVYLLARVLQILKRGRPPHYYRVWLRMYWSRIKHPQRYVNHSATWRIGRSYECKKSITR